MGYFRFFWFSKPFELIFCLDFFCCFWNFSMLLNVVLGCFRLCSSFLVIVVCSSCLRMFRLLGIVENCFELLETNKQNREDNLKLTTNSFCTTSRSQTLHNMWTLQKNNNLENNLEEHKQKVKHSENLFKRLKILQQPNAIQTTWNNRKTT